VRAEGVQKTVRFPKGQTSTVIKETVIRRDVDKYKVGARKGQKMNLHISSLEDNAVFALISPSGQRLNDKDGYGESPDAKNWQGVLPETGDYLVEVSGTRGNATYELKISVVEATSAQSNENPQTFWAEFRAAVLGDKTEKVVALTNFPFKTRGTMDEDPILEHDRKWFAQTFPKLLAIDPGLSGEEGDTMRALIKRTEKITDAQVDENSLRVGDFVFEKIKEEWRFTMAYWDPGE